MDNKQIWHDTLEIVKISISQANFQAWFNQTHLSNIEESDDKFTIEIGCPTSYSKNTIENRYFGLVQDSLFKVLGKKCEITFSVKENPDKIKEGKELETPLFNQDKTPDDLAQILSQARLRPHFTFDKFAVSGSNQMAHAAALAVSESLGSAYNPLFIYGGVGVGKTHLMVAVAHKALRQNSGLKVLFCTGEDFTNDIVEGIRNKTTQKFRDKYRKLDLLLVDDIQFIAGKDSVQEEFFHTFNAVTASGGQVILTSDRPPSEISKLEARLRSRFEAGLIVDIAQPDFELRCAIVQIKAQEKGLDIAMPQIQTIAANTDGARQIEGVLVRLLTEVSFKKAILDDELVESIIGKGAELPVKATRSTPDEVIDAICKYYSIGKRSLLGETRARPIARPRQLLMYLLRTHLNIPLEEVGRLVGGRDHTTVMHAVNKITQLVTSDVNIREDMLKIRQSV